MGGVGGLLGALLAWPLYKALDIWGAVIVLLFAAVILLGNYLLPRKARWVWLLVVLAVGGVLFVLGKKNKENINLFVFYDLHIQSIHYAQQCRNHARSGAAEECQIGNRCQHKILECTSLPLYHSQKKQRQI